MDRILSHGAEFGPLQDDSGDDLKQTMAFEALVSERAKDRYGRRTSFGEAMSFRPSGLDVDLAKCLLITQTFELLLNMVFNAQTMGAMVTLL